MTRKLSLALIATLAFSASLFAETGRYMAVMRRSTGSSQYRNGSAGIYFLFSS